jgi:hypothetical protein
VSDMVGWCGWTGDFRRYMNEMKRLGYNIMELLTTTSGEYTIHVARKSQFFLINYVAVVFLLTAISWLTFVLEPSSLDERAGVTLTLLLAIGVFQLILNDTMPQTGYLTPMHTFILVSSFYVALALCESVVVYVISKRQAAKEAVVEKLTEHLPGFASGKRVGSMPAKTGSGHGEGGGDDDHDRDSSLLGAAEAAVTPAVAPPPHLADGSRPPLAGTAGVQQIGSAARSSCASLAGRRLRCAQCLLIHPARRHTAPPGLR